MSTLGRYTLLRRVATGGMAEIWKAKVSGPAGFSKTVAIKKILPHLVEDQDFIDMFIEEAKLVAELVHPNIVQVFDFGELGPREYFLAMEYVSGSNVGRLVKRIQERDGKMPAGVALYIIAEAARGLGAAHAKTDPEGNPQNIVHRDVSPQNILVSYGGEVKVSDFGIAKAASASSRTAEGMVRGKLAYMSPEQANGKPLDGRADLFALGICLWELLTGKRLFAASSTTEIYARVSRFEGLSPEELAAVPQGIGHVVAGALHPDPAQRYANMLQLETALTSLLGSQGITRAKEMLASMMQSLFDDERRLEATPSSMFAPDGSGSGVVGGMTGSGGQQTVVSPSSPISALTLSSQKIQVGAALAPATNVAPKRRTGLYAAIAAGAVLLLISAGFGAKAILGGARSGIAAVPPTPVPVATAIVAATAVPTATAVAASSPVPTATATPVVAKATPTAVAARTPAPTPAPTRVAVVAVNPRGSGTISVKSRPWVSVWVDGKLATKETPLREFTVSAGPHQVRFQNEAMHFDSTKTFTVPASGELSITVDVGKNSIVAK